MIDTIKELSNLRGISGFEYRIIDKIKEMFSMYSDDFSVDNLGNLFIFKKSTNQDAKTVLIEGHCDEIGLMISGIDKTGLLTFVNVGGIDERVLPSMEVVVHGKNDLFGVIGAKPPHLQTLDESKESMKTCDMSIDTGYTFEEISSLVKVGDSVTMAQSVGKLKNNYISAKAIDDRGGVAVLLDVLERLNKVELDVNLCIMVSVQEEVGLRGAKTGVFHVNPDLAISIDVCHAITPDNSDDAFEAGSGTVISIGPNIHKKVSSKLIEIAKKNNIPYNIDVDGGDTGTNAWAIQVSRDGIPTGLLSIPLRYMHNPVETISVDDAQATADLLCKFILNLDSSLEDILCC